MTSKINVGLIGCGNISPAYVAGCRQFDILNISACADIALDKAQALAAKYDIPKATGVEALLADPDIDLTINLTLPATHAEVSRQVVAAGKHVYSEKPLAIARQDGERLMAEAAASNLRVGCAPDTFLGGGLQTVRKAIDDGLIGRPVAGVAFMMSKGPEGWHPNPDFFYQEGAGPLFDMGPYYLTALVSLLGPVSRVTSSTSISFAERIANSEAAQGQRIKVNVPTHVAGLLEFESGAVVTLITSFDIRGSSSLPRLEIYGSQGTLQAPDPNYFGGQALLREAASDEWTELPLTHDAEVLRGIGVADMAYGITYGRQHRASGEMAYHVLDVMTALLEAGPSGKHIDIASRCERPAALPLGLAVGTLDQG